MPAPLFKRWAPPKTAIKQSPPIAPTHNKVARASSATNTASESGPTEKSRKRKLSPESHDQASSSAPVVEEAPVETPRAVKKTKKRKREPEVIEKGEEDSKKHKTIFSKFEKVSKLAEARSQREDGEPANGTTEQPEEELHDLQPMPQPAPVPELAFEPTFSTLPKWLAQPVTVDASTTLPFTELGVDSFYIRKLEKQGFVDALAVQTALLPMLHPGFEQHLGDICVSAKTGSGKTLAYLLPIIEALKDRDVRVLSAIIVVPSRQLVNQALEVAEELCAGTKIRVGTALGNVAFATEQKQLVQVKQKYVPERAKELCEIASRQFQTGGIFDDLKNMPPDYVPRYESSVDILICTPGRLVEHIENTTGFVLNAVRWLVVDEADQLLNQNFQGWTTVLMDALHGETPTDFRKRERDANPIGFFVLPRRRQLTKVVLSATMEKDLTKLGTLRLKRPKLVVVQDEATELQPLENEENMFELPSTLDEFAVHVGDGSNKPLHLLHVLLNYVFPGIQSVEKVDSLDSDADSDSDSSSEVSSDAEQDRSVAGHTSRVLIFTKSTESASRLSHLLSVLEPAFKQGLKTMNRALTADASRKLLKSFSTGAVKILIASDAASRGLDVPGITHVINYDMPASITSYVHRVGRTARAGKAGQACTLFTKTEAAWFLNQITKGVSIRRGNKKVKRLEWKESTVTAGGKKKAYRAALSLLEKAVTSAE